VVEFFDARCGYCKQMHPTMEQLLRRDGNVRLVLKDLPILGPASVVASRALLAAQRQGKYAELYDALLTLRGEPTEAALRQAAERAGIDWARLRREMEDPAIAARIERNLALARSLAIEGTPAMVIGQTLVPGAVDLPTLERLVAEARATSAARR
jgi:protein-disulfide isomerase